MKNKYIFLMILGISVLPKETAGATGKTDMTVEEVKEVSK